MKFKVLNADRSHAFWASETDARSLIRAGLAKTYGTRRRALGLILNCPAGQAGAYLFGPGLRPATRRTVIREHVAQSYYIYQHAPAPRSAAAAHLALARP